LALVSGCFCAGIHRILSVSLACAKASTILCPEFFTTKNELRRRSFKKDMPMVIAVTALTVSINLIFIDPMEFQMMMHKTVARDEILRPRA